VAAEFFKEIHFTGIVLTKMDGDAAGRRGTVRPERDPAWPIHFIRSRGKARRFRTIFYPERMASRILGMGDIGFAR